MIVHNCHCRNFLGCHIVASPQQSTMCTLVSCSFPGPLIHPPPIQPSCHKVLTSVMPKEPREVPGLGWCLLWCTVHAQRAQRARTALCLSWLWVKGKAWGCCGGWYSSHRQRQWLCADSVSLVSFPIAGCYTQEVFPGLGRYLWIGLVLFALSNYPQQLIQYREKNVGLY